MHKLFKYVVFAVILLTIYFLFEPIFLYNIGKKRLPNLFNEEANVQTNFREADSILRNEYIKLKTPAISIALGMNNKIIWSNSIGYKDLDKRLKINSTTKFRIGSTSKAVTSLGTGILIQQNKLNPDSTVNDYVPYASKKLAGLTLEQVASHTSGVRNYKVCLCFPIWEYYNSKEYKSVKESVTIFNNDNLLFEPSTNFSYSSYNYTLLSAMIEGASNSSFLEFMDENVFIPLNMNNTIVEKNDKRIKNITKFYTVKDGLYKESYKVNNSNKWAGGGFLSTPNDLVKLGNAMLNNTLINSSTTKTLFNPVKLKNGKVNKQNYALGWRNDISQKIFKNKLQTQVIHHGGVAMGASTLLILLPEYNITVAVMVNRTYESFNLFDIVYKFARLFIDKFETINPAL